MENISSYSACIIQMLMEVNEISYHELKKYFSNTNIYPNSKEIKSFNFDEELDKLEKMGIVTEDEGLIIYQGM